MESRRQRCSPFLQLVRRFGVRGGGQLGLTSRLARRGASGECRTSSVAVLPYEGIIPIAKFKRRMEAVKLARIGPQFLILPPP